MSLHWLLLFDFDGVVAPELHNLMRSARNKKMNRGAESMFKSGIFHLHDRGTAEEKLWRAVIAKTLEEWICGPLSFSRKAEKFLFEDNKDFQAVCSSAGMDPDRLRKRLQTIRARGIQKLNVALPIRSQRKLNPQIPGSWGHRAFGV